MFNIILGTNEKHYWLPQHPLKPNSNKHSIPYVLWQAIITLHNIILFHASYSIMDFFYQNFALVRWPTAGALWYVYIVFLLAIFSPILLIIFKNKNVVFFILICIISFIQYRENIANISFQAIIKYGYIPNVLSYLPAYLIGAFYGKFFDELNNADSLKYALLLLFTSRLLFFSDFGSVALLILPILGIYLIPDITKANDLNIYKLTFLIYALHHTIIVDFRSRILYFGGLIIHSAVCMNLLSRFSILIINIILSAIIYIVLRKLCPLLLKLLTGGRI